MQAVVPNGKKSSSAFNDALDKIREDYNRMEAQTASQRTEHERLTMEKMQLQQQQMMYYQMATSTNMELQKQAEAAQRMTALLQSVLQYASPELQASTKQALEKAQQVTLPELMQIGSDHQAQQMQQMQMLGQINAMGGLGGMAGALGGPNGMQNLAAMMNGAMGGMPMGTPNGIPNGAPGAMVGMQAMHSPMGNANGISNVTPARSTSVKRERRSPSSTVGLKKPKVEPQSHNEDELDVMSENADRESVFSDISSASTFTPTAGLIPSLQQQAQLPMPTLTPVAQMPPQSTPATPNGKTVTSYRYDGAGLTPTVFPPDALIHPAVPMGVQPVHYLNHGDVVCSVAMSRDAKRVFTGGKGCVKIWDLAESTNQERATIKCVEGAYVRSCKLFSSETRLAVAGEHSNVLIYDVERQKEIGRLNMASEGCYALTINQDSNLLYVCTNEGTVIIYDLVFMSEVGRLHGHTASASSADLSKDGLRLWTGGLDQTLRTWELREMRQESKIEFETSVYTLGRSPVDEWVAVGLDGKQIEVINTLPGARDRYLLNGHSSCVLSLQYANSGRWFASTGRDDLLNLWSSPHGALAVQKNDTSALLCCEISADDSMIVTGSKERATVYQVQYGNAM